MVEHIRNTLAYLIAPKLFKTAQEQLRVTKKERDSIPVEVNQRVAKALLEMDPFEPLMKKFHGIFSKEYERPEERLDARGQLMMKTLGYQLRDDPSFKFLTNWMMDTQGNATVKRGNPTPETILWGRAQIASTLLFVTEVGRLATAYEEELNKQANNDFDEFSNSN